MCSGHRFIMLGNYSRRFCKGPRIFGARRTCSSSPGLPVVMWAYLLRIGELPRATCDHERNNPRQQRGHGRSTGFSDKGRVQYALCSVVHWTLHCCTRGPWSYILCTRHACTTRDVSGIWACAALDGRGLLAGTTAPPASREAGYNRVYGNGRALTAIYFVETRTRWTVNLGRRTDSSPEQCGRDVGTSMLPSEMNRTLAKP